MASSGATAASVELANMEMKIAKRTMRAYLRFIFFVFVSKLSVVKQKRPVASSFILHNHKRAIEITDRNQFCRCRSILCAQQQYSRNKWSVFLLVVALILRKWLVGVEDIPFQKDDVVIPLMQKQEPTFHPRWENSSITMSPSFLMSDCSF